MLLGDMRTLSTSFRGNTHEVIGHYDDNSPAYFDSIADGIYDYVADNGYSNMGIWIENAARETWIITRRKRCIMNREVSSFVDKYVKEIKANNVCYVYWCGIFKKRRIC